MKANVGKISDIMEEATKRLDTCSLDCECQESADESQM